MEIINNTKKTLEITYSEDGLGSLIKILAPTESTNINPQTKRVSDLVIEDYKKIEIRKGYK